MSEYIPVDLRVLVKGRAKGVCEYCLALSDYSFHPFAIDHIHPTSKGGKTTQDNLAFACQHCNNAKYNKITGIDPLNNTLSTLFHPRQQKWEDHFIWNSEKTIIIGISPVGRTTVQTMKMNRIEAINLRKALYEFGVHPPFLF